MKLGTVGKIIILDELKAQIDYYHKRFPGKEWSGVLFFKQVSGDFETLSNLEFIATNVYLMDIGNSSYTSFENDGDIIDAFDAINDSEYESLMGFIHSH
jgi:hypothetical protein